MPGRSVRAYLGQRGPPTDDRSNVDSGTVAFDSDRYGIGDIR